MPRARRISKSSASFAMAYEFAGDGDSKVNSSVGLSTIALMCFSFSTTVWPLSVAKPLVERERKPGMASYKASWRFKLAANVATLAMDVSQVSVSPVAGLVEAASVAACFGVFGLLGEGMQWIDFAAALGRAWLLSRGRATYLPLPC